MRWSSVGMLRCPALPILLLGCFWGYFCTLGILLLLHTFATTILDSIQLSSRLPSRAAAAISTRPDKTINVANQAFVIGLAWLTFALLNMMYEATIVSLVEGLVAGFVAVQLSCPWALKHV